MARFLVRIDENACKGCELCRNFCPKKLITVSAHINDKGYSPAEISREEECIGCMSCALMCPDGAISIYEEVSE
ncbi:MAG: ferredoxin family protein [Oscillospiraceae bacterium]|nr:ferredoxin family protein [Oscillospiraceae bacterium]